MKQLNPEKIKKLHQYVELLLRWNKKINLIAESTVVDIEKRHIEDSLQLCSYINEGHTVADLGSGAGLPGIVLSIVLDNPIILIEADQRKCIFLREVRRRLNLKCEIIESRVEKLTDIKFDIIVSRAMSSIVQLLQFSDKLLKPNSKLILLKGKSYQQEIDEAIQAKWFFKYQIHESKTGCDGVILEVQNIIKNR